MPKPVRPLSHFVRDRSHVLCQLIPDKIMSVAETFTYQTKTIATESQKLDESIPSAHDLILLLIHTSCSIGLVPLCSYPIHTNDTLSISIKQHSTESPTYFWPPLAFCTLAEKNSSLKKSRDPTKTTRALLRACRADISTVFLPTACGNYTKRLEQNYNYTTNNGKIGAKSLRFPDIRVKLEKSLAMIKVKYGFIIIKVVIKQSGSPIIFSFPNFRYVRKLKENWMQHLQASNEFLYICSRLNSQVSHNRVRTDDLSPLWVLISPHQFSHPGWRSRPWMKHAVSSVTEGCPRQQSS